MQWQVYIYESALIDTKDFDNDEHNMIDTTSAPIQELVNGATCTAYGCHHDRDDKLPFLFNKNVSCTYNLSGRLNNA